MHDVVQASLTKKDQNGYKYENKQMSNMWPRIWPNIFEGSSFHISSECQQTTQMRNLWKGFQNTKPAKETF